MKLRLRANPRILALGVCYPLLMSCNSRKERTASESTAPVVNRKAKEENALKPAIHETTYPLQYGWQKRVIDPQSDEFQRIVQAVRLLDEGVLHEVMFAVELEEGGIEVHTRSKEFTSTGWALLLTLNSDGSYTLSERRVWRT